MKKLLLILGIVLWTCQVWGATYYVKAGGNNSLDGRSNDTAWATISKVSATVRSGDTVYFRSQDTWTSTATPVLTPVAGVTYDGSTYGSGTRAILTTTVTGAAHPIIRITADNVTIKGFNIDGNAKRSGGVYIGDTAKNDVSNTTIDDCKIHNTSGITGDWHYGILVTGDNGHTVYNTTIINSEVYDTFHEGIAIYGKWNNYGNKIDGVLIRNCYIHHTGNDLAGAGTSIAINNDADNVTVEFCDLYNNSASGIGIRVSPPNEGACNILAGPTNMIVRYNLIRNNWVHGITLSNERTFPVTGVFYGNIFYDNGYVETIYEEGADISIQTHVDWTWRGSTLSFYNNTFYNTSIPAANDIIMASFVVGASGGARIGDATINLKNNIFYAGDYPAIKDWAGVLTHSNNLIYLVSGDSYAAVEAAPTYSAAISETTVTISNDSTSTYFTKEDDETDWSTMFNRTDRIRWTGFISPYLGENLFVAQNATKNQIRVRPRVSRGYYEDTVTGVADDLISSTKVCAWNSSGSTWFIRAGNDSTDWRTLAHVGGTITWSGFSNSVYNGKAFTITAVGLNYITISAIYDEIVEVAAVTAEKAVRTSYILSAVKTWEVSAQNTNPSFAGGSLPTGFTGTYGIDMVPNTNYFAVTAEDALSNGANLGSPYNGCINGAGLAAPIIRPQGAYDIGAYQYNGTTGHLAPTGVRILIINQPKSMKALAKVVRLWPILEYLSRNQS